MKYVPALWVQVAAIGIPTGLVLWLYWIVAAPGLTWAHDGADGGDLLAAAMTGGVPHPSGYPLYVLLLRGWLWLGHWINPQFEIAYWGNRFSALCVAGATAFTVATTASLLRGFPVRWWWAVLAGLAFAITPLAWSQAMITEVYGLHALLVAVLGWAILTQALSPIGVGCLMALGAAHHLTSILLWPALLYWQLHDQPRRSGLRAAMRMIGVAILLALPFYGGLLWRVAAAAQPLPIAWGYPRDAAGLWWLVSGAAYRAYLFSMTPLQYVGRIAALVRLLVEQFTPVGFALTIGGFAVWDRQRSTLRNGALLWVLPISLYAAGYNTVDSYIYLLPVVWLLALMLGQGLASGSAWLAQRTQLLSRIATASVSILAAIGLIVLIGWRLPQLDLRHDHEAQDFLNAAATTLEPDSLVISSADAATFALWYGEWGSGSLAQTVPNLVFVNFALYQFGWYRDLMHDLYPDVPSMGASFDELIAANRSLRPIYLTEPLPDVPAAALTPVGIFWRVNRP
jgi:hypothetical protein